MPRICGVSSRSTRWRILRRPSDLSVARWFCLQPMLLRTWVIASFVVVSAITTSHPARRPHGPAASRAGHDDAGSGLALHAVHDRAADARDAEEVLLRLLHTLGDRGRHLLGLAVADAHQAVAVADDHQRGEAEAPTTLDHLGHAVDGDQPLDVRSLVLAAA